MFVSEYGPLVAAALLAAHSASASDCNASSFASLTLNSIEILSFNVTATTVSTGGSGGGAPPGSPPGFIGQETATSSSDLAASVDLCKISISYTHPGQNDVVNTWIGLPLDVGNWNARFQMAGGGGWSAGSENTIASPVADGYSSSSTDGGHGASQSQADWGLVSPGNTNWPALHDFASVALNEAASLGKLATELYYGQQPRFSYWNGCSTGGRQGHMFAQRYPEQFDGIVVGSSAINWQRFQLQQFWSDFKAQELGMSGVLNVDDFADDSTQMFNLQLVLFSSSPPLQQTHAMVWTV